ncbi:hypothetical protein [Streptomyces sp. AGS-58]|uniref:hypothetical protein n=1 Tax=unclassified Streptomyces TaxID=2593676 RepID=UPI0035A374B6
MSALPAYITTALRFAPDDTLCKGDRWQSGCAAADGEAAFAVHTYEGRHYCAYHSPFDNAYVPCESCGEKPAPNRAETEPVCADCQSAAPGGEEPVPAQEPADHVCDEAEERALYARYVDDGLADTDGYFAPIGFEAWQAHRHRAIGYVEPAAEDCTTTVCNAPQAERVKYWNAGTRWKVIHTSVCRGCYEVRNAARRAVKAA